jgi:cellulose synthase/poly-beta-1,6-N-acetylglucosamine synthase-like glycosyltransferase
MFIIENILFYYFLAAVVYILILSVAGLFYRVPNFPESQVIRKICILVPCYKEDGIILSVAKSLSELNYPKDSFDVVILADQFNPETVRKLRELPIIVIEPVLEKSSKANSLNYAMAQLTNSYDIGIISDADNILDKNFLRKVNNAFAAGHPVIQGQRVAKNLNTPFAILDASSEMINNHLFRRGSSVLGLSASIIGSGIAIRYDLLKSEMGKINGVDEDRPFQQNIFESGNKFFYLENAIAFDEKVANATAFQNQRSRWISSQFFYFKKFFFKAFRLLLKGNIDYFNHAIIHNIFPPRALLLLALFFFTALFAVIPPHYFYHWLILTGVYMVSLIIALPLKFFSKDFFKAVLHLPFAMFKMFQALLGMKKKQQNIHTVHTHVTIENPLFTDESK